MTGKKYEKPLRLDMDFEEVMGRFAQTDPEELAEQLKLKAMGKVGETKDLPDNAVKQAENDDDETED